MKLYILWGYGNAYKEIQIIFKIICLDICLYGWNSSDVEDVDNQANDYDDSC